MRRGSSTLEPAADTERGGGEYQVVSLRLSSGAVSIGFALLAVMPRQLLWRILFDWGGWQPTSPFAWPMVIAGTSFAASLLGLMFGFFGLRRRLGAGRSLARFGVIANITVLVLVALMAAAFSLIRWR